MSDLIIHAIGLTFAVGLAALGRWIYLHPERSLEKFNPYGKPYGSFFVRFARIVGALWLFVSVYGLLAGLLGTLAPRILPGAIVVIIFLTLAGLTTWRLLRSPEDS